MSDLYLTRNEELNILGNWFQGKHRDDIPLFDPALFTFKKLYKEAIENEKSVFQLYAEGKLEGTSITEIQHAIDRGLDKISQTLIESIYLETKAAALVIQRNMLIEELRKPEADVPAITTKLLQIQAVIDRREAKPAAANLSANFIKEINEEEAAKKMRYGRGFEQLTKRAGAIRRGQLIVLAARPATGKSAAALQIGYNIATSGAKVLFFPLEMTTQETLERLILQQQIVDSQTALKAPTDRERQGMISFLDEVEARGNFLIYEGVNDLEAIKQTIKEQRPDLVIVDQLTQVRTARRSKDIRERYIEVTADLKAAAIEHGTAILLLTQLNRAATERSAPTLENLHESDATGQNADVVLLMQRKDPDENRPPFARHEEVIIHVVKNRGGASGFKIAEVFNGERYTFSGVSN